MDVTSAEQFLGEARQVAAQFGTGTGAREEADRVVKRAESELTTRNRTLETLRQEQAQIRAIVVDQTALTEQARAELEARRATALNQQVDVQGPDPTAQRQAAADFIRSIEADLAEQQRRAQQAVQISAVPQRQRAALQAQFELENELYDEQARAVEQLDRARLDLIVSNAALLASEQALSEAGESDIEQAIQRHNDAQIAAADAMVAVENARVYSDEVTDLADDALPRLTKAAQDGGGGTDGSGTDGG